MDEITIDEYLKWMGNKSVLLDFCIPAYRFMEEDGSHQYIIDKRHLSMWGGFDVNAFIVNKMHEFTVGKTLFTPVVLQIRFEELVDKAATAKLFKK